MNKNWKDRIRVSFSPDCYFAKNPSDEDRAFELLCMLRESGTGWNAAKAALSEHLRDNGCGEDHIGRQLAHAERYLKPWLLD